MPSSYVLYFIIRATCGLILKIFFRLRVKGLENVPKSGSFIVAGNHTSYVDPVAVAAAIPNVMHFMAKRELFSVRFLGALLKRIAVFPVTRGEPDLGAIKKALRLLKVGRPVVIFPEGGRVETAELGEAELGVGMLAARSKVSVLPVYVGGSHKVLSKQSESVHFTPIEVCIGKPLKMEYDKNVSKKKEAYKEFSNKVMERIAQLKKNYETKD